MDSGFGSDKEYSDWVCGKCLRGVRVLIDCGCLCLLIGS